MFFGQAASSVGDQLVIVALALFIIRRTGSASDLGFVLAAQSLPLVGLVLLGGVWADRLPRHRLMIASDTVRALLHGLFAALIFAGAIEVWQMAVIEALFGGARAFFQPAYSGLLPQTVPEAEIQAARALTESANNVSVLVGPALGTALVLGVGAGEAFLVDAASFVLSAALLVPVRPRVRGDAPAARESVLAELRGGWREVRARAWVWATIGAFAGALFCVYAQWYALAPLIARQDYGGAGWFGILEAIMGLGAVAAALVGVYWRPAHPLRTGLLLVLVWPVQSISFALVAPLALVAPITLATGFAFGLFIVWWETALAQHVPPEALSRVSSYDWMGSLALLPLGFAVAGPLAAGLGARTVLGVGGVLGLVLLGLALLPRSTRRLTEQLPRDVGVELGGEA